MIPGYKNIYSQLQGKNSLDDFSENFIERWFEPGNLKTRERLRPTIVSRVISYEIDNLNR